MTLSMFNVSAPLLSLSLGNLKEILTKGAAFAEVRKIDPEILVATRLYPDMLPLSAQVQIACDIAKGCMARLSGTDAPKYEDNEKNLADLIARTEKTIAYIKSFKAAQIDGSETKAILIETRVRDLHFNGQDYLFHFVMPNVHFHISTAYGLMRHIGVELGKKDFLGPIQ